MKRIIVALVMSAWAISAQAFSLVFEGDAGRVSSVLDVARAQVSTTTPRNPDLQH